MRLVVAAIACALAAFGFCQDPAQPPQQPKGQDQPQQADPAKPIPRPDSQRSSELKVVSCDRVSLKGDVTVWEGRVVLEYKGYRLSANRIEGNRRTNIFSLTGGGELTGEGDSVKGETVTVNFDTETYTFSGGQAVVTPTRTQGETVGNFYVSAGGGDLKKNHYHVVQGRITSCDKEHPHYAFEVTDGELEQGKKLTLRGFALEIGGKTVFRLPKLVIPLYDDRPKYLPEFGQSPDEGYYAKLRYVTELGGANTLDSRFDYMTKLGFGLGADYNYESARSRGKLGIYGLTGSTGTLVGSLDHQQQFGGSNLTVSGNWRRNDYLSAPSTVTHNVRGQLTVPTKGGQSSLGYFRSGSDSTTFGTTAENLSLTDTRNYGGGFATALNATLTTSQSDNGSTVLSESKQLDLRFFASQQLRSLTADLLYQRTIPAGGTTPVAKSNERTPMLTLSSDSRRLFGSGFGNNWPFQAQFSIGQLEDSGSAGPITRLWFDFRGGRTEKLAKDLTFRWNGQYAQGVYSNDTAQYILGFDSQLTYQYAKNSRINVSYRNQDQLGFTPLAIDIAGRSDAFDGSLQHAFSKHWTSSLTTGYDLVSIERGQTPWRLVSIQAAYRNGQDRLQFSTSYDTFNQSWSTTRADGQFKIGNVDFGFGARYDGLRGKFAAGVVQVGGLKFGKVTTDFLLSYNGYTNQFDAQQWSFTYDMHCTEAVLEISDFKSGFRPGLQVAFYIRIKALPFGSDFGNGRRGQRVGGFGGFGG